MLRIQEKYPTELPSIVPLKESDVEGRTYWKGKLKETDIEKRDLPVPR